MSLVWELARSAFSWSRPALVLGAVAVACSGRSVDPAPHGCATDAECAAGQRCDLSADRPVVGMAPCARVVPCGDGAGLCASDEICAPGWQALPYYPYCGDKLCAARCTDASCPADSACGDDGLCRLTSCDAPGAAECPELWRCDPTAAATASHEIVTGTQFSEEVLEIERHMQRGCVRKTCAEEGGFECAAAWSCTPSATINPAGCIPDDCEATGHCSNDTELICLPLAKHRDHGQLDLNGCVGRTCDDGYSCARVTEAGVDVGVCKYGAANADYYGCVVLPCKNDDECFYGYVCDHSSGQSDERGCRNRSCTEGYTCPDGFVCDPKAVQHDAADCTTPEFATSGGASGTGAGGSGASSAGGTTGKGGSGGTTSQGGSGGISTTGGTGGTSGSSAKPTVRGQCVAR